MISEEQCKEAHTLQETIRTAKGLGPRARPGWGATCGCGGIGGMQVPLRQRDPRRGSRRSPLACCEKPWALTATEGCPEPCPGEWRLLPEVPAGAGAHGNGGAASGQRSPGAGRDGRGGRGGRDCPRAPVPKALGARPQRCLGGSAERSPLRQRVPRTAAASEHRLRPDPSMQV